MTKTTARTFATAVVLLAASVTIELYGHYSVARQRIAAGYSSGYTLYDVYDRYQMELETWNQAAGLTGLLAIAVSLVGAMLWDREDPPKPAQGSILMLDGIAGRRAVRARAPLETGLAAELRVDESCRRTHDDESLTPLERVIRGY
jgi:hypothetical protein